MDWGISFKCAIAIGGCYLCWGLLLSLLLLLLLLLLLRGGLGLDDLNISLGWLGYWCWSNNDLASGCNRWDVDGDLFSLSSGLLDDG